ncbi:MAG: hypothetical protein HXX18_11195 [Bacteroidetes bacterium]|nr:hypothetical protein [Bacteroidota bacterium]
MRHLIKLSVFTLFILLAVSCHKNNAKSEQLVTEKIQYDVNIKNTDSDSEWWIQNIEGPQRDKFINLVFNAVEEKKIKIFNLNHQEVSLENIVSNLFTFDTIHLQKNGKKKEIIDTVFISNSFDIKNISKIRFDEKWTFNEKTLLVNKDIKGFCPILVNNKKNNTASTNLPLFWIYPDSTVKSDTTNNVIITKKIQYDVFIKSIDKGKDWWVDNIETTDREKFLKTIIEVAAKGKIKTYDFFMNPLDKKKFGEMLHKTDTIVMQRLTEPYADYDTVLRTDFDQTSILKMRFVEEWSLNTQTFKFYKKVLAICPMVEGLDDKGNLRGYTPLFWIYFDESIKNTE